MLNIKGVLNSLGFSSNLRGYSYLASSISMYTDITSLGGKRPDFTALYKDVADVHHVTPTSVERCMRYAISQVFAYPTPQFESLFHNKFPSVSKFISTTADFISELSSQVLNSSTREKLFVFLKYNDSIHTNSNKDEEYLKIVDGILEILDQSNTK